MQEVEMENCSTPPFDQKSYEETTTLCGLDEEDSVLKRRRRRRSLGRRVSFAETPAYHVFARDDDYVSPSHERQGAQESGPQKVPKRKSPRLASKRQAVDIDDKENWRPDATDLNDDFVKRRSKNPVSKVEQTSFSPGPRPPSWHPARNTSSLAGDDGEISEFVDVGSKSFRQKEHFLDEDVTLDSTTFTFKLSQLQNLKSPTTGDHNMLTEQASAIRENKGVRTRRESPASGCSERDMSMSFTMIKPIIRANVLDLQPGHVDGNTDMSITMQVPRKKNSFFGIDATKQAEVIEILKATLSTKEGSASSARRAGLKSHTSQKILEDTRKKLTKADEETVLSEAAPRAGETEDIVGSTTYDGVQQESLALAAVPENGVRGNLVRTADRSQSVEDRATAPLDHAPDSLIDILQCPFVGHGYQAEIPDLTASYQNDEAMDISVSPTATVSLAKGGCKYLLREPDGSITMDIPSLQDLVREEEDEGMITDMTMETEATVSRLSECVGNLATNANKKSQGSDGKTVEGEEIDLVEKVLHRVTRFQEEGSQFHRDEVDEDRSITLCIPRWSDLLAADSVSPDVTPAWNKSRRKEIQLLDQAVLDGHRFVEENYKQIQDLQARIRTKAIKSKEYLPDKATPKPGEKKDENKCALDTIDNLKERLANLNLSRKEKVEKLLNRTQIIEEAWRRSRERLESSQCRLHDLQTKLAENVRMGHSQAAGLQIAARPDFYVKEMVNKVSLLKTIQDGWDVRAIGHDMVELSYSPVGHEMMWLSYPPIINRRLLVARSLNGTTVTKSNWDLDLEKIELMFPEINAIEAFQQTLIDGAHYVLGKPGSLRTCIQGTRFLVSNLLLLMEEVGRCRDVTSAVAGKGVLVTPRFQIENDKHLQLEIKFLDILLSATFTLTLDLRCAQLNGYPFGAMPTKVDIRFCPPKVSHKLTSAALEAALATVEPGYHKVERLCATVGSLLASIKK